MLGREVLTGQALMQERRGWEKYPQSKAAPTLT